MSEKRSVEEDKEKEEPQITQIKRKMKREELSYSVCPCFNL